MKLVTRPIESFYIRKRDLQERRFWVIGRLCQAILRHQWRRKRHLHVLPSKKQKKNMVGFDLWEIDRELAFEKNTLEMAVVHLDEDNKPDGFIHNGRFVLWRKRR